MVSEVLVLGGGLAGASAALELARAGVRVRLLERETGPHDKVCGEFLSIEAQHDLRRLGLDLGRLGAIPVDRVRLISGERQVEAALPFQALGVSRRLLDEALLEAAGDQGAQIERGVKVTGIAGPEVSTSAGPWEADRILLATGKHDVRGAGRLSAGAADDHIGFKMHWRLPPRQSEEAGNAIELVVFDGGYAGLQRVTGDVLNLCLIIRRDRFARIGGRWDDLLACLMREPHLARRLGDAEALFARPLTIANLPYGYIYDPSACPPAGVFRLGDQGALTAPLTGDGMAIAVRSARLAAWCLDAGLGPEEYHRRLKRMVGPQISRAMLLQRVAGASLIMRVVTGLLGARPALLGKLAGFTRLTGPPPA